MRESIAWCAWRGSLVFQNVLLQIGLNLLSLDGVAVKSVRQYVVQCDACYEYVPALAGVCGVCGWGGGHGTNPFSRLSPPHRHSSSCWPLNPSLGLGVLLA